MFTFAREAKGIPLEQAAHETRIRLKCLKELENDDLTHLSPAYARLFIVDYARYLGVSSASIKAHLPDVGDFGTQGYQYIQNAAGPSPDSIRPPAAHRSKSRALLIFCAILLALIGTFQVWTFWRNLGRISHTNSLAGELRTVGPTNPTVPPKPVLREKDQPSSVIPSTEASRPESNRQPLIFHDQDRVFLSTSDHSERL
jgi:cytoskeletal protein RodZ